MIVIFIVVEIESFYDIILNKIKEQGYNFDKPRLILLKNNKALVNAIKINQF